jgi:hypothetical protein
MRRDFGMQGTGWDDRCVKKRAYPLKIECFEVGDNLNRKDFTGPLNGSNNGGAGEGERRERGIWECPAD